MSHREDQTPEPHPRQPSNVAMFPRPVAAPYGTGGYEDYGMEEDRAGNFNFWETLQVIVGRKFLIAAIVLLGMLAATVITLRSTPLYRAQATVEFQKTESQILEGASVEPIVVADAEYMATQFALLRSRSLAERVAEVLGLPGDPRYADQDLPRRQRLTQATGKILENLSISPEGKSRIGRVQFVSDNPQEAARIANAIAENFIETTLERKYNNTEYARRFLNERLVTTKQALEDSERRLVEYAEEQGILELNQENSSSSLDANSLIALNQELAMAQSERIDAEQKYIEARDNANSRQLLESVDLQRLKATRSELVAEYQERLGEFKPDYPSMVQLKARIDSVEEEIAAERQTILVGLQGEFRAARATEVSLRVRVDELKAILQDARNRRIQYDIIRREVDTNRSQYEALLQRLKEVGIAGSVGSSQVSIVDMAQAPSVPFKPNLSRSLASAFALSLFFGVGLSYALAYIDDTIKTPEDLRNKLGLPPIGVIPKAEEGAGNIIKALDDPRSGISEGFFSARTALQFASPAGTPRSLLVTSTRPGEGKSSTSVSLATVIAKTGKRVLIIDADMRKPSFQTDGTESIGLSGLLTRDEMLRDHVVFAKPNLALLPSGMIPPNPAEILSSPRLADVIRQAEEMFDVVVVDSPPILSFTDAPTLGAACEAAVVVIQAGQIRRPAAQRTVSRLLESRSNVIGGILTKFDVRKAGYDYGYYHYAYGKSAYAYGNERMTDSSREKRKINLFHDDDDGPLEDLSEEAQTARRMKNFRLKLALSAICLAAMAAVGLRALPSGGEGILPYGGDAKSRVDALILGAEEFPEVGPALTDRLTKALEIAPLASEPLFAYALFGGANQEAALKEALRRNPRVLSARLLIAQKLVEEDRYDEAVREVVTLIGVDRDRARDYFAALTEISATEAGQKAILKQLEPARWWTADLALRLNEGSTDFAFLYEVNKLVPQNREAFLRRLVGEGQYGLALLAWLEFSGVAAEDINWPYNERFAERNALPPFNWTVENDRAEFMRGGGLYLVHLARARTLFSRQVMALGPGTYVMNADATGQRASGDGGISLKLRCAGAEDYVASLPLGQMSGAPRPDPVTLTIPPRGCEFQQLEFVGEIGQFPRVSRVEVKSVSIEPIGSTEGEG